VSSLLLSVSLLGKPVLDRTGGHPFCAVFFGQSITDFTNSSVLYCCRMLCKWRGAPVLLSLCESFRVQIPHIYLPFLVEALMGESDVDPITYLVFMPS